MAGKGYQLRLVRTKADALDDTIPATPAESQILKLETYRESQNRPIPVVGFKAKLVFTVPVGNSCDVEVYTRNGADATWALSGTLVGVVSDRMIRQDDIGDAEVYFRLINITAGNPIAIWAEEA